MSGLPANVWSRIAAKTSTSNLGSLTLVSQEARRGAQRQQRKLKTVKKAYHAALAATIQPLVDALSNKPPKNPRNLYKPAHAPDWTYHLNVMVGRYKLTVADRRDEQYNRHEKRVYLELPPYRYNSRGATPDSEFVRTQEGFKWRSKSYALLGSYLPMPWENPPWLVMFADDNGVVQRQGDVTTIGPGALTIMRLVKAAFKVMGVSWTPLDHNDKPRQVARKT